MCTSPIFTSNTSRFEFGLHDSEALLNLPTSTANIDNVCDINLKISNLFEPRIRAQSGVKEMDVKEEVLIAIYSEYQKPLPGMQQVRSYELDITFDEFKFALVKLQNDRHIDGLVINGKPPVNLHRAFEYRWILCCRQ